MIKIQELNKRKKEVEEVSLEKWKIGQNLTWIDCFNPSEKELKEISKKTGISFEDLKESTNPNKRPHVISFDKYSLIIFRGSYKVKKEINTTPIAIFMFKNDVITIHNKPIKGVDSIRKLSRTQTTIVFERRAPYFVYRFIDALINDFFDVMEVTGDRIDKIEGNILQERTGSITKKLFIQKRILIYIYKSLIANRDVISAIEKEYLKEFKKDDIRLFRDLYNDTAQLIDMVSTYRDILTSILDMYLSSVSNSLNKVMKILTAISAFVLIPTLISGIYGMNFQRVGPWNMPELYWKYGYPFAIGLMMLSIIIVYFWFRKKGWLK